MAFAYKKTARVPESGRLPAQPVSLPESLAYPSANAVNRYLEIMSTSANNYRYQLFSSTDHPISGDTEISRYLTFEKFVWLLEKSALYHSRLDRLGDPFEGSVTQAYARRRESGEPVGYMPFPQYEGINTFRLLFCSFVSCWHASPVESAAMWKLYSREDAGVAIVSTPRRMHEAVDLTPHRVGMLGPVEYLIFEKDDMTLPFGKTARPGFLKRKSFEYEKEVRAMIRVEDHSEDANCFLCPERVQSLREQMPLGISASVDLARLITSIYVGPLAPSWFMDLVKTLAGRHGLADLVQKSSLLGDPVY